MRRDDEPEQHLLHLLGHRHLPLHRQGRKSISTIANSNSFFAPRKKYKITMHEKSFYMRSSCQRQEHRQRNNRRGNLEGWKLASFANKCLLNYVAKLCMSILLRACSHLAKGNIVESTDGLKNARLFSESLFSPAPSFRIYSHEHSEHTFPLTYTPHSKCS